MGDAGAGRALSEQTLEFLENVRLADSVSFHRSVPVVLNVSDNSQPVGHSFGKIPEADTLNSP